MRPTIWVEVKLALGEALALPPEQRDAFVRSRCADTRVRDEVMRLLVRRGASPGRGAEPDPARAPTVRAAHAPASVGDGSVLGGRFELHGRLGAGAFGAVYRGTDRLTGLEVAVKVVDVSGDRERAAIRREAAVLRRAHLPGIVELVDDGDEGDRVWIAMRLVEGAPFPGALPAAPCAWSDLAPRAIACIEALGRLHWLGFLHRDVKPENVLVDAAGAVTIVDLGLAGERDVPPDAEAGGVMGTPDFLAPERLAGAPASVAADLYAAGTMLFTSLAGRPPVEATTLVELVAKRFQRPPRLRDLAPGVPPHVADTIDAMIEPDPAARPTSARVVAARLRGDGSAGARPRLPWLGDDAAVRAVLREVEAGRPADIAGTPGAGRSRTLEEVADRLGRAGRRVVRTRAGARPFESLEPVLGTVARPGAGAEAVGRACAAALRVLLGLGVCVAVDDWDAIDAESRAALESARSCGPLVRVVAGRGASASEPARLRESDLRELFHGPDSLSHVREDGARELWRRTRGRPGDVVREVEQWIEHGIARFEDGRVLLDRPGLERLETRLAHSLPHAETAPADLPASARTLHGVLEIAGCAVRPERLVPYAGADAAQVLRDADTLIRADLARRDESGAIEAVESIDAAAGWPAEQRVAAHAAIAGALPPTALRRLFHVVASAPRAIVVRESLAVARGLYEESQLGAALEAASAGLEAARASDADADAVGQLAVLALDAALGLSTHEALARARFELERAGPAAATVARLCAAAQAAVGRDVRRALDATADPIEASDVERQRLVIRQFVAPLLGDDAETLKVLRESVLWARRIPRSRAIPLVREWFGWRRYRQGRFRPAAWLHSRAASAHTLPRPRANCLTNAASASLEAGDHDRAVEHADAAARVSASVRLALHEARATWIGRAARFRRGDRVEPDPDYERALRGDLAPMTAGVALMVEASIALRAADHRRAGDLACDAARLARSCGHAAVECLALGVALAAGAAPAGAGERLKSLLPRLRLPDVRAQSAAMWTVFGGAGGSDLSADLLAVPLPLRERTAADRPLEVLSRREFTEVLAAARESARQGG